MSDDSLNLVPEGSWKARGGSYAIGTAKTGTRQIGVEIILLEGPATGRRLTWYGYFGPSDEAFERCCESLELLGWKGEDLNDFEGLGTTEVYAVIGHEPDQQGVIRSRVQWINELGGVAMADRMDAGQQAAFAAEMRGRLLARKRDGGARGKRAERPTAAASGVAGQPVDDDISF